MAKKYVARYEYDYCVIEFEVLKETKKAYFEVPNSARSLLEYSTYLPAHIKKEDAFNTYEEAIDYLISENEKAIQRNNLEAKRLHRQAVTLAEKKNGHSKP